MRSIGMRMKCHSLFDWIDLFAGASGSRQHSLVFRFRMAAFGSVLAAIWRTRNLKCFEHKNVLVSQVCKEVASELILLLELNSENLLIDLLGQCLVGCGI